MKSVFDNDGWTASTLGHFVSLLIDSGDVAVMYQHVISSEPDKDGKYKENIDIVLLPNGHVKEALALCGLEVRIHKTLKGFLDNGIIT